MAVRGRGGSKRFLGSGSRRRIIRTNRADAAMVRSPSRGPRTPSGSEYGDGRESSSDASDDDDQPTGKFVSEESVLRVDRNDNNPPAYVVMTDVGGPTAGIPHGWPFLVLSKYLFEFNDMRINIPAAMIYREYFFKFLLNFKCLIF